MGRDGDGGSSPRMRGAQRECRSAVATLGIIPAYAGSTLSAHRHRYRSWDHPRVCGEHHVPFTPILDGRGSSPRMRGALCLKRSTRSTAGIIPAYAGSTTEYLGVKNTPGDHPRVCGEHEYLKSSIVHRPGSSPRMRGALTLDSPCYQRFGIIPAYAGSTRT